MTLSHTRAVVVLPGLMIMPAESAHDDRSRFNYDEALVPDYVLPDLLITDDGRPVSSREEWETVRRPELLRIFESEVYGHLPTRPGSVRFSVESDVPSLDGLARLRRVEITSSLNGASHSFPLNIFLPSVIEREAPVFLLINHLGERFIRGRRIETMGFFPEESVVRRGFVAAVIDANDLAVDDPDLYRSGVIETLFAEYADGPAAMGALSAWAWGAMRVMDYFEADPEIDASLAAVLGHSRGGKAALWTGAMDQRWAITISNQSGTGGAALSRRRFGETIQRINSRFGYWFAPNFRRYDENEPALPIDQHALIALMAPRAVYVGSAEHDLWADPRGEYLSLVHGSRVYKDVFGMEITLPEELPAVDRPVRSGQLGYHRRAGSHDLLENDWQLYMDFAETIYGLNT